jgi:hypothetical protein
MAQTQIFKGTARAIVNNNEGKAYIYHRTEIVKILPNGSIQLNSDGWQTVTTKRAMNQTSNQDSLNFGVYQKKGDWFVTWDGKTFPYFDNMILGGN